MFALSSESVSQEIVAVCDLSIFNEKIRSHFVDEGDLSAAAGALGAQGYLDARRIKIDPMQWKIFSHCASVTRLYALYEGYVYSLLTNWLSILPSLYPEYKDLPVAIASQHRVGVGQLLLKLGGGARTAHLTEVSVVEPLYAGLKAEGKYSLVPEAFFVDIKNLRHDELCTLFKRVGLAELPGWLAGDVRIQGLCEAAGTTLVASLKDFVELRNEASHARQDIDETLGVTAFQEMAEFVRVLCQSLSEYVYKCHLETLREVNRLTPVGEISEHFPKADASIIVAVGGAKLSVGDKVVIIGGRLAVLANVVSLQVNSDAVPVVDCAAGQEVGVRFSPVIPGRGMKVFKWVVQV